MLILQIALGIVLAVIILAFLPQILALGAVVLVLGLGLLLLGAAILFFAEKPEILTVPLIALLSLGVVIGVLYGISLLVNRKWIDTNFDAETKESKEATERMANQGSVAPADAEEQRRRNLLSAAIVTGIVALPFLVALPYWLFYKFRGF